jgi:shikimate kinase
MSPYAVLVGPPGAGKSTIGRRLAQALNLDLFDTDVAIERKTGRTIADIFSHDGEPAFREIEERIVADALASHDGILSLGGGAVLSAATRKLLAAHTVVYLEISVSEGLRRTGANTSRPLLAGPDPRAKYQELMRHRRPLYRSVATVRVRTDSRSPARVVNQLVAKLTALAPAPVREVNDETPSR